MDKDLGFASVALLLAVVYYLLADAIPVSLLSDAVGPGGLPKVYAVVLGGLALILMARALARRIAARAGTVREDAIVRVPRIQLYRVGGMLAIGVAYVLLAEWLGYVLTLAALIATTAYYQGGALTRQLGVVAVLGAIFFWVLFVAVLRIPQPPGIWPDLF